MRLSYSALLLVLAATTCAQSYSKPEISSDLVVKRADVDEVLSILKELEHLNNRKRDLSDNHDEYHMLSARADSVLADFVIALTNSGLIGDVFHIITSDKDLQAQLASTIESAIHGLIVQGPPLITAIWHSGLLQEVFTTFLKDAELRDSFLAVLKRILSTSIRKITRIMEAKLSKGPKMAPKSNMASKPNMATPSPSKRDYIDNLQKNEAITQLFSEGELLDKRDVTSTLIMIVEAIYNSDLIQSLISKVLADPIAAISFLTSALKNGVVVIGDLIRWAKQYGLIDSMMQYMENSGSKYLEEIAELLEPMMEDYKSSPNSGASMDWAAKSTSTMPQPTMGGMDIIDVVAPLLNQITKEMARPTTLITSSVPTSKVTQAYTTTNEESEYPSNRMLY